jgi:hypothetical protein
MSSDGFCSIWPSHPHLHFLICKSSLGCFVHFHNSLYVIWSGQKINRTCRHMKPYQVMSGPSKRVGTQCLCLHH